MDETKNSATPSSCTQSQSFKQSYAGTFVAKRIHAQEKAIDTAKKGNNSEEEPIPMELKRFLDWVKNPSNHNAIIAGFTALIFLATAAYAVIATLQWCAMRDQLDVMQRGQRPWVGPESNPIFSFDGAGHPQTMRLAVKNFGQSPALHVGVGPDALEIFPEKAFASLDEIVKASQSKCQWAEMASMKLPNVPTGISIFPNGDATIFGKWSDAITPDDPFLILGCVTYYDQFADTPLHHAAVCFRTYRPLKELAQPGIDWSKSVFQCNIATQVD